MAFGLVLTILIVILTLSSTLKSSSSNGTNEMKCRWNKLGLKNQKSFQNRKFSCKAEVQNEIEYAKSYCNLNNIDNDMFSDKAKSWINDTCYCEQSYLCDLLEPTDSNKCTKIKDLATLANLVCHLKFTPCELSCFELMAIFWKIKGSLKNKVNENLKVLYYYYKKLCQKFNLCKFEEILPQISFKLKFPDSLSSREKNPTDLDDNSISLQISESISSQMKWNNNELDWFVYVDNEDVDLNAMIWVVSKNEINVSLGAKESKLITEIENNLTNAFITGSLKVQITLNSTNFIATSMSPCTVPECFSGFNQVRDLIKLHSIFIISLYYLIYFVSF